jgi:(R)-citramalate synthase
LKSSKGAIVASSSLKGLVRPNFAGNPHFLDTTLRDGEQTPRVVFGRDAKVQVARSLKAIGIPLIEAGSACNGKSERDAIGAVCAEVGDPGTVTSFARIRDKDIDAVVEAGAKRISLVYPASDCHIREKLKFRPDDLAFYDKALGVTLKSLEYALSKGLTVELLAEDGSRANPEYLLRVALEAQKIGAECFCVCDTLGQFAPWETQALFAYLREGVGDFLLSFHGHNDLGMATANSLAALAAGANRIHGTINGLGERTGNCPIEEVALTLQYRYGIGTIDLTQILALSKLVAGLSNVHPARGKPVVGRHALMHDASIHHSGLERAQMMYEPFPPAMIGSRHEYSLGKLSGPKTIIGKLRELDVTLGEEHIDPLLRLVQAMNETGAEVSDADFLNLVARVKGGDLRAKVRLDEITVTSGNRVTPHASVFLKFNGNDERHFGAAFGNGPVDAAISAINHALGEHRARLVDYEVEAISGGSDANVRLNVVVELSGKQLKSSAMGTDIFLVSAEAYLKAVNLLLPSAEAPA